MKPVHTSTPQIAKKNLRSEAASPMQLERDDSLFQSVPLQADSVEVATSKPKTKPKPAATRSSSRSVASDATFSFNPQSTSVMPNGTIQLSGVRQGAKGPQTDRIRLQDQLQPENGQYVYPDGDPRQAKSQTFAAVARAFDLFSKKYGNIDFAFKEQQLNVFADAGKMLQGFYKREQKALIFYHSINKANNQTIYSGACNDVASHECGHAMLDGIRPNYYQSLTPEPRAFHESFGDMMSIHSALCDPRVVDLVVQQTGGDLKKPNVAALIAEEMGTAVNADDGANTTGGNYLRDANNPFVYQDPFSLTEKGPLTELHSNRHSFSRVWTGAHYDLLASMTKEKMAQGADPKTAISAANEEVLQILANLLKEAPLADFTFPQMAEALLRSDAKYAGGAHLEQIRTAFSGRKIIAADFPLPEKSSATTLANNQTEEQQRVLESAGVVVAPSPEKVENIQVHLDKKFGPLQGAKLEIPVEVGLNPSERQASVERNLSSLLNLVKNDRILPNERIEELNGHKKLLNSKGESYVAGEFREGGKTIIRSLAMNICDFHDHSSLEASNHSGHAHGHDDSMGFLAV